MRSLASIRDRVAKLLANAPAVAPSNIDAPEKRLGGEEVERALLAEILAYQRGLSEAIAKLPGKMTTGWPDCWHLEDDQLDQVFRVMDSDLANRSIKLHRARSEGVVVVRQADGSLSDADAERVRGAEAEGRPTFALNFVPPLEHMGIDVKRELSESARRGNAPYEAEAAA